MGAGCSSTNSIRRFRPIRSFTSGIRIWISVWCQRLTGAPRTRGGCPNTRGAHGDCHGRWGMIANGSCPMSYSLIIRERSHSWAGRSPRHARTAAPGNKQPHPHRGTVCYIRISGKIVVLEQIDRQQVSARRGGTSNVGLRCRTADALIRQTAPTRRSGVAVNQTCGPRPRV